MPDYRYDPELRERMLTHLTRFERRAHAHEGLRRAAVALALLPDAAGNACFVITRRAPRLRAHAGQWALPGGRLDAGETANDAALRELSEEVGLTLEPNHVLGQLDDYTTRSGYVMTPVVVWGGSGASLTPNPDEVAAVFRARLAELDRSDVPQLRTIPESPRPVISIPVGGVDINAPTAAILYQLREVALHGRDTRVDAYEQPLFAWS